MSKYFCPYLPMYILAVLSIFGVVTARMGKNGDAPIILQGDLEKCLQTFSVFYSCYCHYICIKFLELTTNTLENLLLKFDQFSLRIN